MLSLKESLTEFSHSAERCRVWLFHPNIPGFHRDTPEKLTSKRSVFSINVAFKELTSKLPCAFDTRQARACVESYQILFTSSPLPAH